LLIQEPLSAHGAGLLSIKKEGLFLKKILVANWFPKLKSEILCSSSQARFMISPPISKKVSLLAWTTLRVSAKLIINE
jgi:hypothetical protein